MRLLEMFESINGEGLYQGYPTLFLRFSGCNLSCSYCDTAYSHDGLQGEELTYEQILKRVIKTGHKRITITGGEPLMQGMELYQLCNALLKSGFAVEVETNGSMDIVGLPFNSQLCITMDWKLPSSGMMKYMNSDNLKELDSKDVIKFVCGSKDDLDMARHLLMSHHPRCSKIFSPVFGKIEPKEIVEYLLKHKMFDCKVQIQSHKVIWPPDMRGV